MKNQIYKRYVKVLRTHFAAQTSPITVQGEPFYGSSMSVQDRPRQCTSSVIARFILVLTITEQPRIYISLRQESNTKEEQCYCLNSPCACPNVKYYNYYNGKQRDHHTYAANTINNISNLLIPCHFSTAFCK